jgi:diketogulonate reductase-like aldo/keto reductase
MSSLTRFFKLNDGHSIPWIAIGSGSAFFMQDASGPIAQAIVGGVTHIDTSQKYRNEESVGAGIARAGVPRDQLFITTKLEGAVPRGGKVIDSLRGSLKKLGLDYVDLFLIHSPLQHDDLVAVWKGMEECKKAGLARSIGGANFQRKHLEQVVEGGSILPAVNQVSLSPFDKYNR